MGKFVIFCAAEFDALVQELGAEDYVIAADGGLKHTQKLNLVPDAILGDFDSLGYAPEGANVFPVEKDDTDAMLAVRHGLSLGYREFILYASVDGPRLDHTVANFQTLQYLADNGATGSPQPHITHVSQQEVDRLLDKISQEGINSLTDYERAELQFFREQMQSKGR